mgnify:CR=1 FL=1
MLHGIVRPPVIWSGLVTNSKSAPLVISSSGFFSNNSTCFWHRSITLISSLSIRATSSFLQCLIPSFSALPRPQFFTSRTTFKVSPISCCFAAITASNSRFRGPSQTSTKSSGFYCFDRVYFQLPALNTPVSLCNRLTSIPNIVNFTLSSSHFLDNINLHGPCAFLV